MMININVESIESKPQQVQVLIEKQELTSQYVKVKILEPKLKNETILLDVEEKSLF